MIVRELVTRLGFKADDDKVRKMDRAVRALKTSLIAASAAAGAMTAAAVKLANEAARYGDELAKTADKLGIQTDALEQLRYAAERSGVAQQTLDMALQRMTRRLSEAAQGSGEAKGAIEELGLNAQELGKMTPDQQLETLADALGGVESQADKVRLAFKFFDSEGVSLVNMLGEGSEEVRRLRDEFERLSGGLTEDQARAAEAFTDSMTNAQFAVRGLRLQIGARLMPVMQPMIDGFTDFIANNRELIAQGIAGVFERISEMVQNLMGVATGIADIFRPLVDAFLDLDPAMQGVATALAVFLGPFGRFKGLILAAGFVAALEDIGAWMRDQPSAIGGILGPYRELADRIGDFVESVGGAETVVKALIGLALAKWLWGIVPAIYAVGLAMWANPLLAALGLIAAGATLIITNWEEIEAALTPVFDWLGQKADWVKEKIDAIGRALGIIRDEAKTMDRLGINPQAGAPIPQGGLMGGGADGDADALRQYLNPTSFGPTMDQVAPQGPVNNNSVQTSVQMDITVPPGTTAEQVQFIRSEVDKAISREVQAAAVAIEA